MTELTDLAKRLVDGPTFAVMSTINPDGAPQSSVIWVKRDGDQVVFSTIRGRRKTRNMERDPRVNVTLYDPASQSMLAGLRGAFVAAGADAATATSRAHATLFGVVQRHAAMVAFVGIFQLMGIAFVVLVPLVLLMKRPRARAGPAAH